MKDVSMPRYPNNGPSRPRKGLFDNIKKGFKTIKDEITGADDPYRRAPSLETINTRAFKAVQRGDVTGLEKILDESPTSLQAYDREQTGDTLLTAAVRRNDMDMVKMLLKKGADVNASRRDRDYNTSPHYMTATAGFEKRSESYGQGTALFYAAHKKNAEMVKTLLAHKADPNIGNRSQNTPLHIAAEQGALEIVKLLTDRKRTQCDVTDKLHNTPLFYAVMNGHHNVVEHLLQEGADAKRVNRMQNTYLHASVQNRDQKMVQLFLSHSVPVDAVNSKGQTALGLATPKVTAHPGTPFQEQYDIVRQLIKAGADVDRQSQDNGGTILHDVAHGGHVELVRDILNVGADPDICTDDGETALLKATRMYRDGMSVSKYAQTIELLLHYGADVTTADAKGNTPLIEACENGRVDLVKTLLKKGADVNARRVDGRSALTEGVGSRNHKLVEILLSHGADDKVQVTPGQSLIDLAKTQYNTQEMIALLREWPNKKRKLSKDFAEKRLKNQQESQQKRHQNMRDYTGKNNKGQPPSKPGA